MAVVSDLIRRGVVCGTCADEGITACDCYSMLSQPTDKEDPMTIIPTPIDHVQEESKVTVNLDSLDDAQQNLLNAERAYENASSKRADIIRRLREAGYRDQVIADHLGVTRSRVGQIAGPRPAQS